MFNSYAKKHQIINSYSTVKYIYISEKTEGATKNGQSRVTSNIGYTRQRTRQTKQKSLSKKTKKMSNTDHTNTRGRTQVLARVGHFLSLIRNPSCYSYIQDVLDTTMASKHTQHK